MNCYDRQGNPISYDRWGELHNDMEYKRIALDPLMFRDEPVTVSTVWLGLDHSFGAGPPIIFETMVFGGPYNQECWRYSTEQQAREGHALVCHDLVHRMSTTEREQQPPPE